MKTVFTTIAWQNHHYLVFSHYLIRWWLSLFTKLQLILGPISCPFPNCAYTKTTLIHMLQFPLSSYSSSCKVSLAKSHLTTPVQLPMVYFIFLECPGLAALLSLASVVTKQRQSVFTIQHPILLLALPILQHVLVQLCDLCQYCVGTFTSPTTSHRRRNRSGWSGHGQTILSRS